MTSNRIKVLLADDHQIVLEGLEDALSSETDIEVVGTALDGRQALAILERSEVDIAVLDLSMPRMNGLETTQTIRERFPEVKILALTMHKDLKHITEMINAGVRGYILKNRGRKDLVSGIHAVMRGDYFWGEEIGKTIATAMANRSESSDPQAVPITTMEQQVLELIAEGMTTKEIADRLCRAVSTIETHKTNLKKKLNVRNEKLLVRYAVEHGFTLKPGTS